MTLPTHAIIGIACYYAIPSPEFAVTTAILSHPVLDTIFCIYHPPDMLKLDSFGKKLLFGFDISVSILLILLIGLKWKIILLWGLLLPWLGWDFQWVLRYIMGKDIFQLHQWIYRSFYSNRWQYTIIEIVVAMFGLFVIWRNI